jgi:predicted Zn-dependent protease
MRARVLVVWVLCVVGAGCAMPYGPDDAPGEGPGGRRQPLALSPRQELAVGRRAYREVLDEYRDRIVPRDDPRVERCRRVVGRLAKAAEIEPLQREINLHIRGYRFDWEVNVLRDDQVNAFCLPGGFMAVFTSMFAVVGRNDDALATVLSHEMAHALAHHASERVARERTAGGILRSLSYQRDQEIEADRIGVFLMAFAGYDPNQAVQFWKRMRQAQGGRARLPEFLSDHPSDQHRIRILAETAPRALEAKRAYDEGRIAPAPGRR